MAVSGGRQGPQLLSWSPLSPPRNQDPGFLPALLQPSRPYWKLSACLPHPKADGMGWRWDMGRCGDGLGTARAHMGGDT